MPLNRKEMARTISSALIFLLLPLLLQFYSGKSELQFNYYAQSCPRAEEIIKEQVVRLYSKHGNTAVSWVRNLFHDCMVKSCDASLLLETVNGIESEKASPRSFGMRNFKYVNTIKAAVESECPMTVSCADIVALSARDGVVMLGGPRFEMKTGRRDSTESYGAAVEDSIPNHNDSISLVLSRFQSIGVDVEGTVALLGSHSVGRVHCVNLVHRIYPTVDPTIDPDYAEYLKRRCPTPDPDPQAVLYSRNDRETPMILDNNYYKNLLGHKGLLMVDQQLTSDPLTSPYVEKMAADNGYFHDQFSRAVVLLSENNPLTGDQGEIRKDCRFVNSN
ncbi:PEROXIDASE 21 [Salix koriyanagi]|uniref:Peroxidase n=1 Tax=Salix koriyanagi TaxID=2511006 RepID=A0A9Q0VE03_9ROSI|nr:PEROXIDASE 21 [Salix koriyanagi]